jgi:hypothetical protein
LGGKGHPRLNTERDTDSKQVARAKDEKDFEKESQKDLKSFRENGKGGEYTVTKEIESE